MLPDERLALAHVRQALGADQRAARACVIPILICVSCSFPRSGPRVTAFAVWASTRFQAVVLAALRQRLKGWRPAGTGTWEARGLLVNVLALGYGIMAIFLLPSRGTPATGSTTGWWLSAW